LRKEKRGQEREGRNYKGGKRREELGERKNEARRRR
jgi:hypothetical protein